MLRPESPILREAAHLSQFGRMSGVPKIGSFLDTRAYSKCANSVNLIKISSDPKRLLVDLALDLRKSNNTGLDSPIPNL